MFEERNETPGFAFHMEQGLFKLIFQFLSALICAHPWIQNPSFKTGHAAA
jgi:hypothetical protein